MEGGGNGGVDSGGGKGSTERREVLVYFRYKVISKILTGVLLSRCLLLIIPVVKGVCN